MGLEKMTLPENDYSFTESNWNFKMLIFRSRTSIRTDLDDPKIRESTRAASGQATRALFLTRI